MFSVLTLFTFHSQLCISFWKRSLRPRVLSPAFFAYKLLQFTCYLTLSFWVGYRTNIKNCTKIWDRPWWIWCWLRTTKWKENKLYIEGIETARLSLACCNQSHPACLQQSRPAKATITLLHRKYRIWMNIQYVAELVLPNNLRSDLSVHEVTNGFLNTLNKY